MLQVADIYLQCYIKDIHRVTGLIYIYNVSGYNRLYIFFITRMREKC